MNQGPPSMSTGNNDSQNKSQGPLQTISGQLLEQLPPENNSELPSDIGSTSNFLRKQVNLLQQYNPTIAVVSIEEAIKKSEGDAGLAQFLLDQARVPPDPAICRHLLQGGCFRRDCWYAHNTKDFSCSFWLRGECLNGSHCRFAHDFSDDLLVQYHHLPSHRASQYQAISRDKPQTKTSPLSNQVLHNAPPPGFTNPVISSSAAFPSLSGKSFPTMTTANNSSKNNNKQFISSKSNFAKVARKNAPINQKDFDLSMTLAQSISSRPKRKVIPTVRIPQNLWNPHESRDASAFLISDPLERYHEVARKQKNSDNIIDLHFQSTKTYAVVLDTILPDKLNRHGDVWIVTGTGHHVGAKTHQKSGGILQQAVIDYLDEEGYTFFRGKDRNGEGGVLLVKS